MLLLYFGLRPTLAVPATPPTVVAEVTGYMWWWRVRYIDESGTVAETANELRLPRGEPVELRLASEDVIHSLWIPALATKLDLIPGATNTLVLESATDGLFEGACAEYCGTAHAQMRFDVEVVSPPEFVRWLERLRLPAREPGDGIAARGATLFRDSGCGACHTVRGTSADGRVGPVLTHVGSRHSLGAGVLAMSAENAALWVGATDHVKPGVHMPAYAMLSDADLEALGVFLAGLE
jgi:cytochrome c oxidase subunit 2